MSPQRRQSDSTQDQVKCLVREANAAEANGDGEAALTLLRQAQVLAPQHQGLVASMVRILLARDEVQEATELAESLVAADPASVPGLIALASCQRYRRQLPEAIATYERAAALDPIHPGVQAALATLGQRSVATNVYTEAAVGALIDKAEQNFVEQDLAKALANFRQALALHPGNPDLLAASARCQRQLGQVDQAKALLQQSLQEHPNHFSLLLGLAELEADRGHWWVASDWYGRAKAADPAAPGLEEATEQSLAAASALPRRLMLVLGMHRSGSSATAGLLCGHGFQAPLPAHTAPASDSDSSGHWQAKPVVSAHDTLLEEQGLGWANSFLPTAAWESALLPRQGEAIGEALRLAFDNESFGSGILVVKDPRQCRLQPIWNRLLNQHGLEAAVVLQQRHPLAVARSLLQRDRMPVNRSLLLWLQHSLAAERHTRHLPRLIVDYDQVMADPGAVLARCQELWPQHHFDSPGASADSTLIPAIDPSLNHAGADPAADMADLGPVDTGLLELALAVRGILLGPEEYRSDQLDEAWYRLERYIQRLDEQTAESNTAAGLKDSSDILETPTIHGRPCLPMDGELEQGTSEHAHQHQEEADKDQLIEVEHKQIIEDSHILINSGNYLGAKKKLLGLMRTSQPHTKAWAYYHLSKCLFDQYQLNAASFLCSKIFNLAEISESCRDAAEELGSSISSGLDHQSEMCAHYIKPSYYLKQLKKARPSNTADLTTNAECYRHYQKIGAKISVNPAPWFDTHNYRTNNQDVAKAGLCPFFHYIAAGKEEGRAASSHTSRFAAEVASQSHLNEDIYEECRHWLQMPGPCNRLTPQEIISRLEHPYILSISHDCYYKSPGGIQLCIQREQTCYNARDLRYIHLYPRQPSPIPLHKPSPYIELTVSCDGVEVGVATLYEIGQAILSSKPKAFVVHSLLGASPEDIHSMITKAAIPKVIYWMHDYSALCSSYQLLRNKITFCAAPSMDSEQCNYCYFGNSRANNVKTLSLIINLPQTEIVFPSYAALDVWEKGASASSMVSKSQKRIINHIALSEANSVSRDFSNRKPRIAFLGHPAYGKGWDTFSALVRDPLLFNSFDWYHLGATKTELSHDIEFLEVSIAHSPTAMVDTIKEAQIDYALIWPEWPETFCLTAYEAVIGGACIITNEKSGNVAAFANSHPYGEVLPKCHNELKQFLHNLQPDGQSFPHDVKHVFSQMSAEIELI